VQEKIDEANETLEQLELLIGKENAHKVFEFFEGEAFYFPKRIGLSELHHQIYAELQNGKSYADVARKYEYSKSYIRKIEHKIINERRAMRKAGIQPPEIIIEKVAEPVKVTALTSPPEITPTPFAQGELFYGV
jgi:hypothetical protein